MHPNRRFNDDAPDLLARAAAIGFAHVFAGTVEGPMVVHAPVTLHGDRLRFHVARANRIAPHLDRASLLLSVVGADGYVSPNWYAIPGDQVPTWNYIAVEVEGRATAIGDAALVEQLDKLADAHEPRPGPWTRAKTDPAVFARMLRAIQGFELEVTAVRGTSKLSQNKSAADRSGVIDGLRAGGNMRLADAMEGLA